MGRVNIRLDDKLKMRVHSDLPHGLQERLLRNLIRMAFAPGVNPAHVAVAEEGEYVIVKKGDLSELNVSVEPGVRLSGDVSDR